MRIVCLFVILCFFGNVKSNPINKTSPKGYELSLNGIEYVSAPHLAVLEDKLNKLNMIEVLIISPDGLCGGTIISDKFILTAAHCFIKRQHCFGSSDESTIKASIQPPNKIQVFIEGICYSKEGSPCDKNDEGRSISAKTIHILTEYYTKNCTSGDLAIIELDNVIGDHGAKLFVNPELPQTGKLMVSGFAIEKVATSHLLKTVTLTVQKCENGRGYSDSICTEEIDKDVCEGDSGGALIDEKNVIYGVVSAGTSCKAIHSSMLNRESDKLEYKKWDGGIFTAVSLHLGFICEIIGAYEGCPETLTKEPFLTV